MTQTNDIEVIYVPWYLKANMDAMGMDIDDIKINLECDDNAKVAISDLNDLRILNVLINRNIFSNINSLGGPLFEMLYNINRKMNEDVRIKKEIELVNLLSKELYEVNNTFTLMYRNNTVYVILNEGFTNFIKFNNQADKYYLIESLTNFMFKHFNNADVYVSKYFKTFLSLKN